MAKEGTMSMRDPWADGDEPVEQTPSERSEVQAVGVGQLGQYQSAINAAMQYPIRYVPVDWQPAQMRMQCLHMALTVPDGAAPPPLAEVIERAEAYWSFVKPRD